MSWNCGVGARSRPAKSKRGWASCRLGPTMQLMDGVHLVGSGWLGLSLTHPLDSNVYLIVEGSIAAVVDAGAGRDWRRIFNEIAVTGVTRIAFIALTHKHADHIGGAARLAAELDAHVYAPAAIVTALADADEDAVAATTRPTTPSSPCTRIR
jgi:hydroxyacylglutathione hydrolase